MAFKIQFEYGTATAPAMAWGSDTDTGIYGASGRVSIAVGGNEIVRMDNTGIQVVGAAAGLRARYVRETELGFIFGSAASTTSMVYDAVNERIVVTINGTVRFYINDTGIQTVNTGTTYNGSMAGLEPGSMPTKTPAEAAADANASFFFFYNTNTDQMERIFVSQLDDLLALL